MAALLPSLKLRSGTEKTLLWRGLFLCPEVVKKPCFVGVTRPEVRNTRRSERRRGLDTTFIIGPIDPSRSAVLRPYGLRKRHG